MFKLTSMSTDALFIAVCLQGSFYGKSFLDLSWPLLNLEVRPRTPFWRVFTITGVEKKKHRQDAKYAVLYSLWSICCYPCYWYNNCHIRSTFFTLSVVQMHALRLDFWSSLSCMWLPCPHLQSILVRIKHVFYSFCSFKIFQRSTIAELCRVTILCRDRFFNLSIRILRSVHPLADSNLASWLVVSSGSYVSSGQYLEVYNRFDRLAMPSQVKITNPIRWSICCYRFGGRVRWTPITTAAAGDFDRF